MSGGEALCKQCYETHRQGKWYVIEAPAPEVTVAGLLDLADELSEPLPEVRLGRRREEGRE